MEKMTIRKLVLSGFVLSSVFLPSSYLFAQEISPEVVLLTQKGNAIIATGGAMARDVFEVKVKEEATGGTEKNISSKVVHKDSGLECLFSLNSDMRITIYGTDSNGRANDVSCGQTDMFGTTTLYAFKRENMTIERELEGAVLAIQMRMRGARELPDPPLSMWESFRRENPNYDGPPMPQRVEETEGTMAKEFGFNEGGLQMRTSAWVGKKDDWFIKMRFTSPAAMSHRASTIWSMVWMGLKPEIAAANRALRDAAKPKIDPPATPAPAAPPVPAAAPLTPST